MSLKKFLPIFNLLAFLSVLVVNYLANALPLAGRGTGEISDLYPNLFTPSRLTFSIWGIIYLLLGVFIVNQLRFIKGETPVFLEKIGWLFFLSCLANMGWLFAWHHLQIGVAMLVMLILLGSVLTIYMKLDIGNQIASKSERWMVHLPFSVYLGWLTVATIANFTILLVSWGWQGEPLNPQFWTMVTLVAVVSIGIWALLDRRDYAFMLVIGWAIIGIYLKRKADTVTPDHMVEWSAIVALVISAIAIQFAKWKKRKLTNED